MKNMARQQVVEPVGNNLLRALRLDDWAILEPMLEEWSAPTGLVLHAPGDTVRFAYFPCGSSLISYLVVLGDGRAIETALVGREGAVGGSSAKGAFLPLPAQRCSSAVHSFASICIDWRR